MNHTTTHTKRAGLVGVLLISAAIALSACSSGPGTETAAEATTGIGAKWGACMRDAGFDVQDPSDDVVSAGLMRAPQGADEDAFSEAGATCARKAGVKGSSSAEQQKWDRQYAQVASCIQDHGYPDFPAPRNGVLSTEGFAQAEDPGFEQVWSKCLQEFAPDTKTRQAG